MASGMAVKLPLTKDPTFGAKNLITDFETLARQNLKMLILTNPGERMMNPDFWVGLSRFLFEPNTTLVFDDIKEEIDRQVKKHLPYIGINSINVIQSAEGAVLDPAHVVVAMSFTILPIRKRAELIIG